MPPVGDYYQPFYSSVKDTVNDQVIPAVEPITSRLGKTLKNDVGPTLKDAVKNSLNAVFTGVPKVITQVSCYEGFCSILKCKGRFQKNAEFSGVGGFESHFPKKIWSQYA